MAISRQRLRDIYDVISENGYQGDYDSFEAKFSDHDNQNNYQYRLRVFATMRGHGATDAATYEDFMKSLQPQSPQPKTPQAPAPRPTQPSQQNADSKPAANAEQAKQQADTMANLQQSYHSLMQRIAPNKQAKADGNSTASLPPAQQAPAAQPQPQTPAPTWKPTQAQKEEMAAEVQRMTDDAVAGISGGSERIARVVQTTTPEWREQQRIAEQAARMAGADVSRPLGLNPGASADETADGGKGKNTKDSKDTRNIFAPRTSPQVVGHTYDENGNAKAVWQLGNGDATTDRTKVEIAEFAARQARQADKFANRMKANGLNPAKAEDIQKQASNDQFDVNHAELIKRQAALEAELQELYNRREQEEQKRASKRRWWEEIGHAANEANRNMHPTYSYVEFPIDATIRDKQAELIKIERTLRRERQAASAADSNWFSNLFKGIGSALTDVDTYTFGAYSASANKRVNDAIKAGGTATEEQKQLLRTAGVAQEQQDKIGGLGIYDTGAFVGGMMASPEMWAGALAGKAISAPMRRLLFGKASEAVVGRMLPSARLWRRAAMASGSGAANFAAFEGVGNARQQLINGGEFSIGDVVHSTIRGSILGATTGVVGSLIGNVGDKVIKSVISTPGKAASWLGKHVVSAVAEGTIFAVPQYFDPKNKMDWWDVEAENISMIFGMKLGNKAMGAAKMASAPMKASQRLRSLLKGDGKTTFSQRMRAAIEASPVKLTQEERNELAAYGYGSVEAMLRRRKGDIRDENGRRSVTADYADDVAGYDAINALMSDPNVSEAARAKVYYIVTGHTLPMHAVMGWNIVENNGRYVVESTGAGNQVITRRVFGSRDAVDAEVDKIRHQVELNSLELGERVLNKRCDDEILRAALQELYPNVHFDGFSNLYSRYKQGEDVGEQGRSMIDAVEAKARSEYNTYDDARPQGLRRRIAEDTGIDIDEVVAKKYGDRSPDEQAALQRYLRELFGVKEQEEKQAEPTEATKRIEGGDDATMQDDTTPPQDGGGITFGNGSTTPPQDIVRQEAVDAMNRAYDDAIDTFGENTEQYASVLNDDPLSLLDSGTLNAEQEAAVLAFYNARERARRAAADDDPIATAEVVSDIEGKAHRRSGVLIPATMRDGREVYVVQGDVVANEDGSINIGESSDFIIVADANTGEITTTSPRFMTSRGEAIEMQVAIDRALQQQAANQQGSAAVNEHDGDEASDSSDGARNQYDRTVPATEAEKISAIRRIIDIAKHVKDKVERAVIGGITKRQSEDFTDLGLKIDGTWVHSIENSAITHNQNHHGDAKREEVRGQIAITEDDYAKIPDILENYDKVSVSPNKNTGAGNDVIIYEKEYGDGYIYYLEEKRDKRKSLAFQTMYKKKKGADSSDGLLPNATPSTSKAPSDNLSDLSASKGSENGGEMQAPVAENAAYGELTALQRIPVGDDGEPVFESVDKETAWDGLVEAVGGEADAAEIALAQVQQAATDLETLKKKAPTPKLPKLKGSPMAMVEAKRRAAEQYQSDLALYNQQLAEMQARLEAWNGIIGVYNSRSAERDRQQREERRQRDAQAYEEAMARDAERKRIEAEKEAEQAAIGTHAVNPKIKAKWDGAPKIEGNADVITLPDGSQLRGRYYLTEAGAASASHDPSNGFAPTEGFPIDANGQSVNDRDYHRDKDAQRIVKDMAEAYDSRALQSPVVVSQDGVVLSGNNRTMSGDIAARQGTDKAYVDYMRQFGAKYGFTREQVGGMRHPRVVFVPEERLSYDAATFSRFNAQEMKSQSKPEAAVKLGKTVPDDVFGQITNIISGYDRLSDFYSDEKAVAYTLGLLLQSNVINDKQMPELRTGAALSAAGKELIENILIGKVFQGNPDAVRQLIEMPGVKQSVVMGLSEIAANRALAADGYDLTEELANAVDLVMRAKAALPDVFAEGVPVSGFGRQSGMFDDEYGDSSVTDAATLLLADILNSGKPSELRKVLASYNKDAGMAAAGQMDIFSGEIESKETILKRVKEHFKNATTKEQQAIVDAAIAERKRRATEQGEGSPTAGQTPTANESDEVGEAKQPATTVDDGRGGDDGPTGRQPGDLEKGENINYQLSDEVDENGHQFVLNSSGSIEFGRIGKDTGLTPAPILLSEGVITNPTTNAGYELLHIEARHGNQIRAAGYASVLEFVEEVAKNYEVIRKGNDRDGRETYMLQLTDKHNNTLMVELSGDGTYWNINTAGIFKTSYGANRTIVYDRHTTDNQPAETDGASLSGEQSGTTPSTRMNASTRSVPGGKGNTLSGEKQEDVAKSAESEAQEADGDVDMLQRKWEAMKEKMPEGTVFIVEHNGRYYAFGDDATRVNAALTGKGDAARTDMVSLDEKQYEEALEVLNLKGFSVASYSAKDIKDVKQQKVSGGAVELTPQEQALTDGLVGVLRDAGIEVIIDNKDVQRVLDDKNRNGITLGLRLAIEDKENGINAVPTAISGNTDPSILSSTNSGTKIDNRIEVADDSNVKLDELASKIESNGKLLPKDFLLSIENALGSDNENVDKSQYFKGIKGNTLRIANHRNTSIMFLLHDNATGNTSIVVKMSERRFRGHKDVEAEEYVYFPDKLTKEVQLDIIDGLKEWISTGKYNRECDQKNVSEIRRNGVRMHKVYHGSGADFDAFDFSHMGEGEGNQAYGYGGYVTEVEGIGRTYAKAMAEIKYKGLSEFELVANARVASMEKYAAYHVIKRMRDSKSLTANQAIELEIAEIKRMRDYGEMSDELANRYIDALLSLEKKDFSVDGNSTLYTIEVPDDNGRNYLHWESAVGEERARELRERLFEHLIRNDEEGAYEDAASREMLQRELAAISGDVSGADVYGTLSSYLGSDKAASEFLRDNGFVGVSYPAQYKTGGRTDKARNFVIFDEGDMRITDKARFFRTSRGEVYGFTIGGKIYIDPRIATAETPIHEYAHLWAEALRRGNATEWSNVVELMRKTPIWGEVKKKYPELTTDSEIAEEVLAHYSGRRGAERLRQEMRKAIDEADGAMNKAIVARVFGKIGRALSKFWRAVADMLHIHYTSAEEVADRVLYDLLRGFKPGDAANTANTDATDAEIKGIEANAKANGTYMRAPNGKPSKLTPKQWAQVRTKAFKQWFGDWEKAARIEKLRRSESVSITGKEIELTDDFKQNKKNALAYGKKLQGEYTNADTGVSVQLQRGRKNGGVNEVLQHNYKDNAHILSVAAIPQIIEKSIYIESEPNKDAARNPNVVEYQHFVCGLKIGNEDYTVHSLVAVDKNGNRYYDHNLTHIEKTKLLDSIERQAVNGQGFDTTSGTKPTTLNGYKGKKLSKLLKANSSKVVDENGEPRVVYHGTTTGGFYIFDNNKGDSQSRAPMANGFFFSSNKTVADGYSIRTIATRKEAETHTPGENDLKVDDADLEIREVVEHIGKRVIRDYVALYKGVYVHNSRAKSPEEAIAKAKRAFARHYYTDNSRVYECFVHLASPYIIDADGYLAWKIERPSINELKSNGYDGIIIRNTKDNAVFMRTGTGDDIVAFYPSQIKSATENIGTFDGDNPDIRYQVVSDRGGDYRLGGRRRGVSAARRSLFDEQGVAAQRSLFDDSFFDEQSAAATPEATDKSDLTAIAERVNKQIDEYCEQLYDYLSLPEGEEIPKDIEDGIETSTSALRVSLKDYYLAEGNTEDEAAIRAAETLSRVRAQVSFARMKHSGDAFRLDGSAPQSIKADTKANPNNTVTLVDATGRLIEYSHNGWLRELEDGEFCHVQRQFEISGQFGFSGTSHIESADDVAYIFRNLECYAVEHSFAVVVKDGESAIIHLGMGNAVSSPVDFSPITAAVSAFGGVDKVYFVHNHPSGALKFSAPDMRIIHNLQTMLGDASVEAIVLDTTSGKYGYYDAATNAEKSLERPNKSKVDAPLKVAEFGRQVFTAGYDQRKQIKSPGDVAAFLSSLRLGRGRKLGVLVLDNQNCIIGNYYCKNVIDTEEFASEITRYASFGAGRRVILYGNKALSDSDMRATKEAIHKAGGDGTLELVDAIAIKDAGAYESAIENGVFEEGERYGDMMRMSDESEPSFSARRDRAVKENGYVYAGLNSAEVKVVSIKEKSLFDTNKKTKALKQDVIAYANKYGIIGTMTEEETKGKGKVTISKASIEKMVDDSATDKSVDKDTHLAVIPQLREVIAESIMAETHPDYIKGEDGERKPENGYNGNVLIHRCYGALNIDGTDYRVKITLKEDGSHKNAPHKAYTYEVTEIELLDSTNGKGVPSTSYTSNSNDSKRANGYVHVAKLLNGVEKSYDNGKKLLDESKKADIAASDKGSAALRLGERLNTKVNIVSDVSEITNLNTAVQARQRRAKGMYDPLTGEVTIVLPNNADVADVENTALHEIVGHDGLRVLFPDKAKLDHALDELYRVSESGIKATIDATAKRLYEAEVARIMERKRLEHQAKGEDAAAHHYADMAEAHAEASKRREQQRRAATEEYGANLAGRIGKSGFEKMSAEELTFWGKFRAILQKALSSLKRGLGIKSKRPWTDKEWAFVLHEAYKAKLRGNKRPDAMDMADTAIMRRLTGFGEDAGSSTAESNGEPGSANAAADAELLRKQSEREIVNSKIDAATAIVTGKDIKTVRQERREREAARKRLAAEIYRKVLAGEINDVTLQQINEYINDSTPRNRYGRPLSQRLPQGVERALYARTPENRIDVLFSRISESGSAANESAVAEARRERQAVEERKKKALELWAKASGNWHTDLSEFTNKEEPIDRGTDSDVYLSKDGKSVIKLSKGKPYGKRFRPDIDNIALFNYVFPNSAYRILGYGDFGKGFVRILQQPIVDFKNAVALSADERTAYMDKLGFKPINEECTAFSNGEIIVSDLQRNNIVKDAAGNISVIDADCKLHTKDIGGKWSYPPTESDLPQRGDAAAYDGEGRRDDSDALMYRDGEKSLEETITEMRVAAMQANEGNLQAKREAMRAIGGNLNHLRQAMARQREYDVATAKSVKDLAQILIDAGLLSDMSAIEVKGLLKATADAIGRQDISGQVKRVFDIMLRNHLRNQEADFASLTSMRGSRVDARGIQVQGELDADGQMTLSVFNRAKSLKSNSPDAQGQYSQDSIEWYIGDAMDRMSSDNEQIASAAATEYAALISAKTFIDNVTYHKNAEKQLRQEMRKAEQEYKAGLIDKTAFDGIKESIEEAIQQEQMQRIEGYEDVMTQLGGVLGESVERAKAWREAQKEHVRRIQHLANSDMQGREGRGHKTDTRLQKLANNPIVRYVLSPLASLDQMLKMFGSKNANGEGYLWNYYMRGIMDSLDNEQLTKEHYYSAMDEATKRIFGKDKYTQLYVIADKGPSMTVKYYDGVAEREYELSQQALMYLYAVDKMPMGRATNRRMGITDEFMEQITQAITPQMRDFIDWVQEELLPELGKAADEVHQRMFGAHMDAIENYFPFVRDNNAIKRQVENGMEARSNTRISLTTGAIKKRVASVAVWDMRNINFLDVLAKHVDEMVHWLSFAEMNRDLSTLQSYNRFHQQVLGMSSMYGAGETLWQNFTKVCAIATDSYEPMRAAADKTAVQVAKGVTMGKISARPFTALKQTLSLPAFFGDVDVRHLSRSMSTAGIEAMQWAWKNMPNFRKRILSRTIGDYRLKATEYDTKIMKAATYGMMPNIAVDAWTIAIGAHAKYLTSLNKYLQWGMDKDAAHRRAVQDAELCYNKSQQSSEGGFMAPVQVDHSWLTMVMMLFRNASTAYTREVFNSARNLKRITTGQADIDFMAKQWLRTMGKDEAGWTDADWVQARRVAAQERAMSVKRNGINLLMYGWMLPWLWRIGAVAPSLLLLSDTHEKDEEVTDTLRSSMFGPIEGLAYGDVAADGLSLIANNAIDGEWSWGDLNKIGRSNPLSSDIAAVVKDMGRDWVVGVNDILNIVGATWTGVNPQTLTDWVAAIMDASDDRDTRNETALLVARLLNCPQSQLQKLYLEELDMNGDEASRLTPVELAERYAAYKTIRETPMTGWMRGADDKNSSADRARKVVLSAAKDKAKALVMTERNKALAEEYRTIDAERKAILKTAKTDIDAFNKQWNAFLKRTDMQRFFHVKMLLRSMDDVVKQYVQSRDAEEMRKLEGDIKTIRDSLAAEAEKGSIRQ